ncbi:MAG: type II secretion system major pseudopilin GspG [Planctomycetes bacterium]|nr:type II secretion system major pseudopilin GspG [Planctomycetota bacterium]
MRRRIRRRSAFTLIEVLLVAGILALLAAFAVPQLFGLADKAKFDLAKTAIGRNGPIAKALDAFNWDMGRYPETDEGLAILMTKKGEVDDDRFAGPYLNNDVIADPWGSPFEYRSPGEVNEDTYDLWSIGKDRNDDGGKEGSDDIKNWTEK